MKSIAFITCYFGAWPWYFPYFLKSCASNPDIQFFLVTDNDKDCGCIIPENVVIVKSNLASVKQQFDEKLNITTAIADAYKLCDVKPAYGLVFNHLIKGFDFWGHCDIDIVWGRIMNFMTPELLENFDLITGRHDFLSGTFTLFRNCNEMNELFMQSHSYPEVFTNPNHLCFDECNFLWKQIGEMNNPLDLGDVFNGIDSMTHVVRRKQKDGSIRAFFDFMILEGVPGNILWKEGKLTYKNEFEVLLYHLIKFKKVNDPSPPENTDFDSFRIGKKRFYNIKSNR